MMRKIATLMSVMGTLFLLLVLTSVFDSSAPSGMSALAAEEKQTGPAPVEDDMHEFMEYVFQPTYKRLKQQMALETKDRSAWKQIKSDALILAEGGNLTMMRGGNDSADWNRYCQEVRDLGGQLYRSAKAKDDQASHKHYVGMLTSCNACHKQFAGGKHMLKP